MSPSKNILAPHLKAWQTRARATLNLLDPPPALNVWQWAEKFRRLPRSVTARPGRYSVASAPYQREPQEAFTDQEVQTVVLYWGKRLGKTECLNNLHAYTIHFNPRNILHCLPTLDSAKKWSKQFFMPMIRASRALASLIRDSRMKDANNTILSKEFPGGTISAIGANSVSGFRQVQAPVVTCDEIDAMEDGPEGDPVTLAFGRAENYPDSIQVLSSTATKVFSQRGKEGESEKGADIGSKIHSWWLKSDQRKWFCPCPKCGTFQVLKWSQVKWIKDDNGKNQLASAWYECENQACAAHWDDLLRTQAILAGEWRATAPFNGIRGYWLNGLNTTFPAKKGYKTKLHQFAAEFYDAYTSGENARRAWKNTFLCEPEVVEAETINPKPIMERQEAYTPQALPAGILVLSAQIDVQVDRLECEIVGMGHEEETWGIEVIRKTGNPERNEVWNDLARDLGRQYLREDGVTLKIACIAVDIGYRANAVRKFIRHSGFPRVYAVFGSATKQPELVRQLFKKHYRMYLYSVNTAAAKDTIFARLKMTEPGPRYMHFPIGQGYDKAFFSELTAEERRLRFSHGFPEYYYEKTAERNEALDLRVYFLAAMDILKPDCAAIATNLTAGRAPREYQLKPAGDPAITPPVTQPIATPKRRRRISMGGGFRL